MTSANDDHYFWVKPINDTAGEAFDTLEEAIAEGKAWMELEAVHAVDGPCEVVEVNGTNERVVWRAEPRES